MLQVAERSGPAPRGQPPGPVHHVAFQDGPQRVPFGLEQRLPGGRQHVGDVRGRLVAIAVQTAPPPPDKSALQKAINRRELTPATPN
jgi:hypothetical protein